MEFHFKETIIEWEAERFSWALQSFDYGKKYKQSIKDIYENK